MKPMNWNNSVEKKKTKQCSEDEEIDENAPWDTPLKRAILGRENRYTSL